MKVRFSKPKVIDHLEYKIDFYKSEFCFDPRNGWGQVDGKGEDINRAYGRFTALIELLEDIEDGTL